MGLKGAVGRRRLGKSEISSLPKISHCSEKKRSDISAGWRPGVGSGGAFSDRKEGRNRLGKRDGQVGEGPRERVPVCRPAGGHRGAQGLTRLLPFDPLPSSASFLLLGSPAAAAPPPGGLADESADAGAPAASPPSSALPQSGCKPAAHFQGCGGGRLMCLF